MTCENAGGRQSLLLLCHRIPYPPDKGDKIRSFQLLRHLGEQFDLHLGAFVDDPADWEHAARVESFCASCKLLPRPRIPSVWRMARAFAVGEPLSLPFYHHPAMAEWVERVVDSNRIGIAVVFSAAMGQYVLGPRFGALRKIIDFVDVDSDKWRQYARQLAWPKSQVYRREARCLLAFEQALHSQADASLFVSAEEAALFRELATAHPERIDHVRNGVDAAYFDPGLSFDNPYPEDSQGLVFTGAMDYWPNIDAVTWFVSEVLPGLRAVNPSLVFFIVGSNPASAILRLKSTPGVVVTGRVADVRPYLQHALAAVAPLRIARGIQNKVLEAMAMAKPVLVSRAGLEGIPAADGSEVLLAESTEDYARHLQALAGSPGADLGRSARSLVLRDFSWSASLARLDRWMTGPSSPEQGKVTQYG